MEVASWYGAIGGVDARGDKSDTDGMADLGGGAARWATRLALSETWVFRRPLARTVLSRCTTSVGAVSFHHGMGRSHWFIHSVLGCISVFFGHSTFTQVAHYHAGFEGEFALFCIVSSTARGGVLGYELVSLTGDVPIRVYYVSFRYIYCSVHVFPPYAFATSPRAFTGGDCTNVGSISGRRRVSPFRVNQYPRIALFMRADGTHIHPFLHVGEISGCHRDCRKWMSGRISLSAFGVALGS